MKPNSFLREEATLKLEGKWGNMALTTFVFGICLYIAFMVPLFLFLTWLISYNSVSSTMLLGASNPNSLQILSDIILPVGLYCISYYIILILLIPFFWGYITIFLNLHRKSKTDISNLFDGYSKFKQVFFPMLLCGVYLWLWGLLFGLGQYLLMVLCLALKLDSVLSIFISYLVLIPYYAKCYSYAMTPYIIKDYPELTSNEAINKSIEMMAGHKWKLFCLHLSFLGWGILTIFTCGIGSLWLYPYILTSQAAFYEDRKAELYPETTEEEPEAEQEEVAAAPAEEKPMQKEVAAETTDPKNEGHYLKD